MNKFIYFFISLGFIISCSSGVGGDDSIIEQELLYSYLIDNTFYNSNQHIEDSWTLNDDCHSLKLIFNEDSTGLIGGICMNDTNKNFLWELDQNKIKITGKQFYDDQYNYLLGNLHIPSYNQEIDIFNYGEDVLETSSNTFFGFNLWNLTPPPTKEESYLGFNFKRNFLELIDVSDGLCEGFNNDSIIYYNDNHSYSFCDLNPSVIINNNDHSIRDLECSNTQMWNHNYNISFDGKNLIIFEIGYEFKGCVQYRNTHYTVVE